MSNNKCKKNKYLFVILLKFKTDVRPMGHPHESCKVLLYKSLIEANKNKKKKNKIVTLK